MCGFVGYKQHQENVNLQSFKTQSLIIKNCFSEFLRIALDVLRCLRPTNKFHDFSKAQTHKLVLMQLLFRSNVIFIFIYGFECIHSAPLKLHPQHCMQKAKL